MLMKVRTTAPLSDEHGPIPIGTLIERENCHELLDLGKAEPADLEAEQYVRFHGLVRQKQRAAEARKRAEQTRRALAERHRALAAKWGIDPAEAELPSAAQEDPAEAAAAE